MNTSSITTRFCPSPTGLIHLGNLRTALFNVLLALSDKSEKGHFLLRIEDTDKERSKDEFTEQLMADLRWLSLDWQEGPGCEGEHAPYYQSGRIDVYERYYEQLIEEGHAYWCFCSEAELSILRKSQLQAGMAPRYPGTCRHLTAEQIEARKAKGKKGALRFRVPDGEVVNFEDFIQGPKVFETDDVGDFIIKKADGSASFMFCNALDDALMQVTHVMRGEDHLTNTPRQLLLLKRLNLTPPAYGHMPLIVGFDGKPLSKRNGSQSVDDLRRQGYFPLAINNYLARLGHSFESDGLMPLKELGKAFSVKRIGRSPSRFDIGQLDFWQKEALVEQTDETLWSWMSENVDAWVVEDKQEAFTQVVRKNVLLPKDAGEWAERLLAGAIPYDDQAKEQIIGLDAEHFAAFEQAVESFGEDYASVQAAISSATALKGKKLFFPLRAILTGRCFGPELAKIFSLMGKPLLLQRFAQAKTAR